jgi:hypothetical protein
MELVKHFQDKDPNLFIPWYASTYDSSGMNGNHIKINFSKYPENWFFQVNYKTGLPVTGKQSGYMIWSEIGFKENLDKIKEAFHSKVGSDTDTTWNEFLSQIDKEFEKIRKKKHKRIQKLTLELESLKKMSI